MKRFLSLIALLGAAGAACAHPGHDVTTLQAGLVHPFGLDHLLAMVAVGVWSAAALPASRRLAGPALFMTALTLGALAGSLMGAAGFSLPGIEPAIAASVVMFGLMLAGARRLGASTGLALIAVAATLHGMAHGAELPAGASFAGYAAGFLAATALLHGAGLGLGRVLLSLQTRVWHLLGAGVGLTGLMLLART